MFITVDVTTPGSGGDLLWLINAPALTDARLDGFRAHTCEGLREDFFFLFKKNLHGSG